MFNGSYENYKKAAAGTGSETDQADLQRRCRRGRPFQRERGCGSRGGSWGGYCMGPSKCEMVLAVTVGTGTGRVQVSVGPP